MALFRNTNASLQGLNCYQLLFNLVDECFGKFDVGKQRFSPWKLFVGFPLHCITHQAFLLVLTAKKLGARRGVQSQ